MVVIRWVAVLTKQQNLRYNFVLIVATENLIMMLPARF